MEGNSTCMWRYGVQCQLGRGGAGLGALLSQEGAGGCSGILGSSTNKNRGLCVRGYLGQGAMGFRSS